jgi:hypothetical protein
MRRVDLADLTRIPVTRFDSAGVTIAGIAADTLAVHVARLDPGGVIGRHPAAATQLLVVLEGIVDVTGHDGSHATLDHHQGVLWAPGEEHETRTVAGATLLLIEHATTATRSHPLDELVAAR